MEEATRRNPFKSKRPWPPDFSKLSPKHQFRLERRYKRRTQLKYARPRLMAATRIAQWVAGVSVLAYGVFYMDWNDNNAFKAPREWLKGLQNSIFTNPEPPSARLHQTSKASNDRSQS